MGVVGEGVLADFPRLRGVARGVRKHHAHGFHEAGQRPLESSVGVGRGGTGSRQCQIWREEGV